MRQVFTLGVLIVVLTLQLQTLHADDRPPFHGFGLGPAKNVDVILTANPPLPRIAYEPGNYKFTVQPSYYYGTNEFIFNDNEFKGGAIAFNYTKVVGPRWGWYVSGMFNRYGADQEVNATIEQIHLTDINANFFDISGGVHYLLTEQKTWIPNIVFIGGPHVKIVRFSQTYFQESGFRADGSISNDPLMDFDMESNPVLFGLSLGGRLSWRIYDKIALNFFGFLILPFSDRCQSYKVTEVRLDVDGGAANGICGDGTGLDFSSGNLELFGGNVSGGFSIEYIPWQVSLNVSAPLIKAAVENYNEQDTTIISLSKSFGGGPAADPSAK